MGVRSFNRYRTEIIRTRFTAANFCVYFVIKLVRTTVRTALSFFSPLKFARPTFYDLKPRKATPFLGQFFVKRKQAYRYTAMTMSRNAPKRRVLGAFVLFSPLRDSSRDFCRKSKKNVKLCVLS